jgi:hypothetical protein
VSYLKEPSRGERLVRDLALVLLGPSASGKTACVRRAAAYLSRELVEVYPDDKGEDVGQILRRARRGSVVLLEGVDAMSVTAWSTERTDAKVIATASSWLPIFKDLRLRRVKPPSAAELRRLPVASPLRVKGLDLDPSRSYDVLHAIAKGERHGTFDDAGSALEAIHRTAASLTDLAGMAMLAAAACFVDSSGYTSAPWCGAYLHEAACVAARRHGYSPWGLISRRL